MDNEEKRVKIASSIIILERVRSTSSGVSKVSDTKSGSDTWELPLPMIFFVTYYQIAAQKKCALSASVSLFPSIWREGGESRVG